eukprot:gnl/TRDRNA2_/TRDRNA2_184657_c0_seq1.p1 gnl/TRDRNA2_/TRDRNA2_184657_c0~~gnl/TRDRNA2_/TRDRNA2_184657_c0_seq1.p1  ORF type:complete len:240 (+),score=52.32 gnl/TRDRNA2_/TRDRNA2_184657_c0_seq1:70-789(+)
MAGRDGEIRYDDPSHAQQAMNMLNGSMLAGSQISIEFDMSSKDSTKLIVHGIPPGIQWQELKDHFKVIGTVAYSGIKGDNNKGGGKGGGGKMMAQGGQMGDQMAMMQNMMAMMQNMQGMMGGNSYGKAGKGGGGGGAGFSPYGGTTPMNPMMMQPMGMTTEANDPPGSGRVFVRGFDFGTTKDQVQAHMSQAGTIVALDWISDGSAEVVYQTSEEAQAAAGLDKSVISGNRRFIDVKVK